MFRRLVSLAIMIVVLFYPLVCRSQAPPADPLDSSFAPKVDMNPSDYPKNVWITDGMVKIHQDSGSPGSVKWAVIYAAKNEFESFQIHEQAGGSPITLNSVTISDLVNAQTGTHISATTNILVYREAYQNITVASDSAGVTGLTPDILIPTIDPYYKQARNAFPVTIAPGQNQSVWIDILVPTTAPSGYYSGTATLTNAGSTYATLPILLAVWNFSLPSTSSLTTSYSTEQQAMCLQAYGSYAGCSVFPGAGGSSDTAIDLMQVDVGKMMLDHRISDASLVTLAPPTTDFTQFDSRYGPLLDGTARTLLSGARLTDIYYYPAHRLPSATLVQNWATHFNAKGWLPQLEFPVCDEPPSGCNWTDIPTWAAPVLGASPPIRTMVTTSLSKATSNGVLGSIKILADAQYDLDSSGFGGSNTRPGYNSWISGGGTLWWYISDGTAPLPQYFIDATPVRNRVNQWLTYLYNISGELYFDMDFCFDHDLTHCGSSGSSLADPWVNIRAFNGNGEGTLYYPGTPAKIGGTTPVPIPSIRLKLIRDGMEDYEYLHMLNALGQYAFATTTARGFITNITIFSNNSVDLQNARLALGNKIHSLSLSTPSVPLPPPSLTINKVQ
jgi:hypothetical protein